MTIKEVDIDAKQLTAERLDYLFNKFSIDDYCNNEWQDNFESFFKQHNAEILSHFAWLEKENKDLRDRVEKLCDSTENLISLLKMTGSHSRFQKWNPGK